MGGRIVKSSLATYKVDEFHVVERVDISEQDKQLTSLRQASEWGNKDLVEVFRRLKNRLATTSVERSLIMWSCLLMNNWRINYIVYSQTMTYFNNLARDEGDRQMVVNYDKERLQNLMMLNYQEGSDVAGSDLEDSSVEGCSVSEVEDDGCEGDDVLWSSFSI